MHKYAAFSTASVIISATVLASPLPLHAAETKQIARSEKLGIELFGVGGESWCQTNSQLQLSRTDTSPLIGKEETLFPKISKVFASECPQMETADIVVHDAAGTRTRDFKITKETGWAIAAPAPSETAQADPVESETLSPTTANDAPPPPQTEDVPAVAEENSPSESASGTETASALTQQAVPLTNENLYLLVARLNPDVLNNDRVIDQLASLESCDRYQDVRGNEFALRDWRNEVRPVIESKAKAASDIFEFSYDFRVDRQYDFDTKMLDIGSFTPRDQSFEANCGWRESFHDNAYGGKVLLTFEKLPDTFNRKIYLPDQLGRSAVDQLQANRNKVRITYRARITNIGIQEDWRSKYYGLKAEFLDVKIRTGEQFDYLLVHHEEDKFSTARRQHQIAMQNAEEEDRRRQIEQENAEAQSLYESLAGDNATPAKLAALHHDGDASFNNPYTLAATAYTLNEKLPVRTFVHVGDRDSAGYRADWPTRLYLTGTELEEDEWYFVSGMVSGQKIDDILHSMISVDSATKCDDRICMDEQDVIEYVRSRYPQWSGQEE
ncbi:hypothetical protein LPB41_29970 [Thalassospira sp. MA62]|nr:hypothetical protein [Thalassospira sp. MA62]